jgi:hypothetical protein
MSEDLQSKAAELMKKVLTVGVGAIFLTEESLQGLVSEFKLPKELLAAILESANKTKGEFLRTISDEVISRVMEKLNVGELIQEMVTHNEIELEMTVRFKPKKKKPVSGSSQ